MLCDPMNCSTPGFPVLQCLARVCSTSYPLSCWCHPTIPFSVTPFPSCPQSFPASGSFPVSGLFASSGQSFGASASAYVLLMNIQGWFPFGLTGLISLLSKGLKSLLQHHSLKASILRHSVFFIVQLSHPCITTGKTIALTRQTFVSKVMSLVFYTGHMFYLNLTRKVNLRYIGSPMSDTWVGAELNLESMSSACRFFSSLLELLCESYSIFFLAFHLLLMSQKWNISWKKNVISQ